MNRSEQIGQIAAALAKAQKQIEGASKDARNPHFNSRYADLAAISDACRGPLAANEIAVIQNPCRPEAGLVGMTTLLLHASGEWLESDSLVVQAKDAGPQAVGSCITYLRRYQLAAMVGVAPADDDDAEAAEARPRQSTPAARPKREPVVDRGTGEERPAVPPGFYYLTGYRLDGQWHEATILDWDAQGGSLKVSTKIPMIGAQMMAAANFGTPVRPDVTLKKNSKGEAYLNKLTVQTDVPKADPLDEDPIPF